MTETEILGLYVYDQVRIFPLSVKVLRAHKIKSQSKNSLTLTWAGHSSLKQLSLETKITMLTHQSKQHQTTRQHAHHRHSVILTRKKVFRLSLRKELLKGLKERKGEIFTRQQTFTAAVSCTLKLFSNRS